MTAPEQEDPTRRVDVVGEMRTSVAVSWQPERVRTDPVVWVTGLLLLAVLLVWAMFLYGCYLSQWRAEA